MKEVNLVLGANGHLGNNIVRLLTENNETVRGGVRNITNKKPFEGLGCEIVYADLIDKSSLMKAMEGVDTLYVAAAVYKSWAKDIQKEIIDINIEGTGNVIEVAAMQGVKKVIYTSTVFTCSNSKIPMDEFGWNNDKSDPYTYSKVESEKLALELAGKYGLWLVSIVPSGMIGINSFGHLTPTMEVLGAMLKNKMPVDPCFSFNLVDVRDIAQTMIKAKDKGRPGERYILAQLNPISSTEVFKIAKTICQSVKIPKQAGYNKMFAIALISEFISKLNRQKPLMLRSQVKHMYKADFRYDTSKAQNELGFTPKPAGQVLKGAFKYLLERQ